MMLVSVCMVCNLASAFVVQRPPLALKKENKKRCLSSRLEVSPSGIDALPVATQALTFGGIYAGLGLSTVGASRAVAALDGVPLFARWRKSWALLGVVYALIGLAHFATPGAFEPIVPPQGTWGFWNLPGTASFHVAWTGAAEIAGGTGLVAGAALEALFPDSPNPALLRRAAAAGLFLLTFAVTPANIYMYTHGALMPGAGPDGPLDLSFHYVRFLLQVLLLTILASEATRPS
eukprot:CAMPEP_0118910402 /NCGR_PEP_ID=MMETSP1166-20130328/12558_1 /TAXON_ID=1104430 /ORGANISM="Chrysoreinhardia sp, Strain CCMP3193" /LENGTH=233 /DNA_ID=CAMNT_0006849867 /DNA_START=14 /DNA_END=715 /DNA_ORIENTATION=-